MNITIHLKTYDGKAVIKQTDEKLVLKARCKSSQLAKNAKRLQVERLDKENTKTVQRALSRERRKRRKAFYAKLNK